MLEVTVITELISEATTTEVGFIEIVWYLKGVLILALNMSFVFTEPLIWTSIIVVNCITFTGDK